LISRPVVDASYYCFNLLAFLIFKSQLPSYKYHTEILVTYYVLAYVERHVYWLEKFIVEMLS